MLQFSSDGGLCAVSAADGRVRVWNTVNKNLVHDIGPFKGVGCFRFFQDGKTSLLGIGTATSLVLYDCKRGDNYAVMSAPSPVLCLAWSVDGETLFSGHLGGELAQWDVDSKALVRSCTGDTAAIQSVCLSENSRYLLSASRTIKLWRTKKFKLLKAFKGHVNEVKRMCFVAGDNQHFLSLGEEDRIVQVWSQDQSTPLLALSCDSHVIDFSCNLAESEEGLRGVVVAAGREGTVAWFQLDHSSPQGPATPSHTIRIVQEQTVPVPVPMLGIQLKQEQVLVSYGQSIKPVFELMDCPPSSQAHQVLSRQLPSNLLLNADRKPEAKKSGTSTVAVTGPVPKPDKFSEVPLSERVVGTGPPLEKKPRLAPPSTESLTQLIVQAVTSQDPALLETALKCSGKDRSIRSTVDKLPSSVVLPLITQLVQRIEEKPYRGVHLINWIKACITSHMTFLSTVPMETGALGYIEDLSVMRLPATERISLLQGKLGVLTNMASRAALPSSADVDLSRYGAVYSPGEQPEYRLGKRLIEHFPKPPFLQGQAIHSGDFSDTAKSFAKNVLSTKRSIGAKVIILGDTSVGKTCLIQRFCKQSYDPSYKATIGVDFELEKMEILATTFSLQLWDTAGNERFRSIARAYYRGAQAVIIAFDLSQITTLDTIKQWIDEAKIHCNSDFTPFIVGCKMDVLKNTRLQEIQGLAKALSDTMNAEFWPTSSATGENVDQLFQRVACTTFETLAKEDASVQTTPLKVGNDLKPFVVDKVEGRSKRDRKCC